MKFLSSMILAVATLLVVVAVPFAIITTNVRMMGLDPSFYEKGQIKYGAMQTIGLSLEQIAGASKSLANYFSSAEGSLASELQKEGLPSTFFSNRETIHLKDVKDILGLVGTIQQITIGYALLFLLANLVLWRKGLARRLGKTFVWGGGITLGALIIFGALSLTDFSDLFLTFHQVSFSNDLWILDPKTDYLISMFPPDFFMEAALTMALNCAMQAVGLIVIGIGLLALGKSKARW